MTRTKRMAVVAAAVLAVAGAYTSVHVAAASGAPVNELALLAAITAYAVVAVIISVARPGHLVGRLMLFGAAAWGSGEGLLALAVRAFGQGRDELAGWLAALGQVRAVGWLVLILVVPLLFPDGRTPWGGRRPLLLAGAAAGLMLLASLLAPTPLDFRLEGLDNPVGLPPSWVVVSDVMALTAVALVGVSLAVVVAGLVHRWRGGDALVRQQLLWFTVAAAIPLALVPLIPTAFVSPWMFGLVSVPLPIAVAVAVFQHRLYDVQLAVNRTVLFVALSVAVAGLYAATVAGVGLVLHDQGAAWLPWVATGVVAVTFAPMRDALQRGVNRLTYGGWSQPADVLATTGRRLADAADVPGLLRTLTQELATGLGLSHVEIVDAHGRRLARYGTARPQVREAPLTAYGRAVGSLRWSGPAIRSRDRSLLEDVAGQIGGVVHAAGLVEELTLARERLVLAREEERRRLRRDLHDGLGPALAGLTLQVDTVRNVLAAGRDGDAADQLLLLRSGVAATVVDVRRIVEGLRPPALDDLGLDRALEQLVERTTQACDLEVEVQLPTSHPRIPAALEVAAYRVTQEALTNVVRHSGATRSRVVLDVDSTGVRLEVSDNGSGAVAPRPGGIGLTTMHERAAELGGRLSVRAAAAHGTTVSLWLPSPVVAS